MNRWNILGDLRVLCGKRDFRRLFNVAQALQGCGRLPPGPAPLPGAESVPGGGFALAGMVTRAAFITIAKYV